MRTHTALPPLSPPLATGMTLAELLPLYMASRRARGLREVTLSNYATMTSRLTEHYGGTPIAGITASDLRHIRARASRQLSDYLLGALRWAAREALLSSDRTRGLSARRPRGDYRPECLSIDQAHALYAAMPPDWQPVAALGLYSGMRPAEALRLRWEHIALAERRIDMPGSVARAGQGRVLSGHQPNGLPCVLWELLEPHERSSGRVAPVTDGLGDVAAAKRYSDARSIASSSSGLELPPDALRHTFAAHHLATYCDVGATADILGHTSPDTVRRHYAGLVSREDSLAYWHHHQPLTALPAQDATQD